MDSAIEQVLRAMGPLDGAAADGQGRPCKICGAHSPPFDVVDFNKSADQALYPHGVSGVTVLYYRCGSCGFMFCSLFDDWTDADFARYVYNDDYVKIDPEYTGSRAREAARAMNGILAGCQAARILDFGSGLGIFEAELRALGFDHVESFDPHSSPARPRGLFDIITAFEVVEHATDPLATFQEMKSLLKDDGIIVFGTALQPDDILTLRANWWYVAPRNGHVGAFTEEALLEVARRLGMTPYGGGLFALTSPNPSAMARQVADRVGVRFLSVTLTAPRADPDGDDWYGLEGDQPAFRWTASPAITWRLPPPDAPRLWMRLRIPVVNQITADFVDGCAIDVNGETWPWRPGDGGLVAEGFVTARGGTTVVLRTPPPLSPAELRGSHDDRRLGLAIRVDDIPGRA